VRPCPRCDHAGGARRVAAQRGWRDRCQAKTFSSLQQFLTLAEQLGDFELMDDVNREAALHPGQVVIVLLFDGGTSVGTLNRVSAEGFGSTK
jgi:hypothetical protein